MGNPTLTACVAVKYGVGVHHRVEGRPRGIVDAVSIRGACVQCISAVSPSRRQHVCYPGR